MPSTKANGVYFRLNDVDVIFYSVKCLFVCTCGFFFRKALKSVAFFVNEKKDISLRLMSIELPPLDF